jgi:hypothetical protein
MIAGAFAVAIFILILFYWRRPAARLSIWLKPNTKRALRASDAAADFVSLTVANHGNRPTTLKSIGVRYYANWFQRLRNRPERFVVFSAPSYDLPLPMILDPNKTWVGFIPHDYLRENLLLEEYPRTGSLIIFLLYSSKEQELRKRLSLAFMRT